MVYYGREENQRGTIVLNLARPCSLVVRPEYLDLPLEANFRHGFCFLKRGHMNRRATIELAVSSFALGSITTYLLMYGWHQRTLKFIGVAYGLAHDEIKLAKGEEDE